MRKVLRQLLKIQCIITIVLVLVTTILPYRIGPLSVALGCGISLLITLTEYGFFRRDIGFIPAKSFYQIMVIISLLKWLTVLFLGTALISFSKILGIISGYEFIGIIIGFSLTYLSYFWLVLKV